MQDVTKGIPVSIKLQTKVRQQGEVKDFLFELPGQVVTIGDTLYIRYKEVQEETEVPVTIKVMPDGKVQLIRSGDMRLRLQFAYREKLETSYRTPYGVFQFMTDTKQLHVSLKDRPFSGRVTVEYSLFSATEKIGDYSLHLEFTA